MKFILATFIILLSASGFSKTCPQKLSKFHELFLNVVSIGASVSSGYNGKSAVQLFQNIILSDYDLKAEAKNKLLAVPSAKSAPQIEQLKEYLSENMIDTKLIFALDLFFWDTMDKCDLSDLKKSVDSLFSEQVSLNIPIAIGTVPKLHPLKQRPKCLSDLNDYIRTKCEDAAQNCFVIELFDIFEDFKDQGKNGAQVKLNYADQTSSFTIKELLPDDLHPRQEAIEYVAYELKKQATSQQKQSGRGFFGKIASFFKSASSKKCR